MSMGRYAFTNLNHQYVHVSQQAAQQSGYRKPSDMIGTTVFDLKSSLSEFAATIHKVNQGVIDTGRKVIAFDVCEYPGEGLQCCLTLKAPLFSTEKKVVGVMTKAELLPVAKLSKFVTELYGTALQIGKFHKSQGIIYEVTERYTQHELTKQESNIVFLTAYGKTTPSIADLFNLSTRTVETHLEHIKNKLGVTTKAQIVQYAIYTNLMSYIPRQLVGDIG